ncbi:MAG: DUF4296 domain-containing protein [Bacteroidetes bacterium]|nr:DUF4296 domain-containing protein [Bacteroidota bacterium]
MMISRLTLLFSFLILTGWLFAACSHSTEDRLPVQREKLTDILFDLQLAEGRSLARLERDTVQTDLKALVLTHHGVSKELMDSALFLLSTDPALFREIQQEIQERLSRVDRSLNQSAN